MMSTIKAGATGVGGEAPHDTHKGYTHIYIYFIFSLTIYVFLYFYKIADFIY